MCEDVVEEEPKLLKFAFDDLRAREMCEDAGKEESWVLQYVPYWFVMQVQEKSWHDNFDSDYCNDELFMWDNGYEQQEAQEVEIKEELMPIIWHSYRWCDQCIPEDDKKEIEKLWKDK